MPDPGRDYGGDRARLVLEPDRERLLQHFDGDASIEPRLAGLVDLAHPTGARVRSQTL